MDRKQTVKFVVTFDFSLSIYFNSKMIAY